MSESDFNPAQKKYSTSGEIVRAIIEYLGANELENGADLYCHCQEDIGYVLMARAPKERPFQVKLAKMFFSAKDYEKAAMVLESNGEHQKAAELYERNDQYDQAAEMWLKVGNIKRAALNNEKQGNWQTAADLYSQIENFVKAAYCFEKAVNHFLAGKFYMQLGKFQKSMELLQKVKKEDGQYLEAAIMIGNILAKHGYLDIAENKFRSVIKTTPLGDESIVVYYNLAKLLEKNKNFFEATGIYKQIAEFKPDYEDVGERLRSCQMDVAEQVEITGKKESESMELIGHMQTLSEEVLAKPTQEQNFGKDKKQSQIVSLMDGFEFLKSTQLFETLSLTEMKRLWTICDERMFEPGEILIEQFQSGRALYIVKQGTVVVQRVDGSNVTDLVTLGSNAYVGEMSLINQAATSARVVGGSGGAHCFEITRDNFDELLASDDKISIKLYKVFIDTLCERLRKTTEELASAKSG